MNRKRANRKISKSSPGDSPKPNDPSAATNRLTNRRTLVRTAISLLVAGFAVVALFNSLFPSRRDISTDELSLDPNDGLVALTDEDEPKIREICSHCHQFPTPDVLPRSAWQETIWEMFRQSGYGRTVKWRVDPEALVEWYEQRAPEEFTFANVQDELAQSKRSPFSQHPISIQATSPAPVVSNIQVADVLGDERPEVIVCDMLLGKILLGNVEASNPSLQSVADVANPAHVEVTDLDADGRADLVVANLGSFLALDHNLGSVAWLRQRADQTFEQFTLADGLGRVADVQPADFDDDGDLDIIVAEFGWHATGHLLLLEHQTPEGGIPQFKTHEIDGLHGASHVDVADLDGDGVREIIVLYSQGHEMVRCYSHQTNFVFTIHDLYRAPSPAWGFSGSQIVDMDRDGDLDILLSNGDTFDNSILKPYHGIRWLENKGGLRFEPHHLGTLYGAYRAAAADLDGDGDQDVAACALITPKSRNSQHIGGDLDSLVWFEQTTSGVFARHRLETGRYHHPTFVLSDCDLDGDTDLLVGNGQLDMSATPIELGCIELWLNETNQQSIPKAP
ncbi:MAG: VCBS repeat-containing protein [Planctomycetes bacterium]|nr:VCBS repeat-containing protein [Planctomycetota bacterium]